MFDYQNARMSANLDEERHLWAAVIERMILDYQTDVFSYAPAQQKKAMLNKDRAAYWLFHSTNVGIGSLAWICDNIGYDAQDVRAQAQKLPLPKIFEDRR